MPDNPFSDSQLELIFEENARLPGISKRRESTWLEFKTNFQNQLVPEYAKTLAAFANNEGGYIVFGVESRPHRLTGMTNDKFSDYDPANMSAFLNDHFSPALDWEHYAHTTIDRSFGLLYAREARRKPIMCTKNNSVLRSGDVYYRYHGQSKSILAQDMHGLIEERVESERRAWFQLLKRISRADPSATYMLDINEGRAEGASRSFIISPELLEKVKFIHEGRFDDAGEPTLSVVGSVEVGRIETLPGVSERIPVDPSKDCNLWEGDVLRCLKDRIGPLIKFGDDEKKKISGYHVREAVKAHEIKSPSTMYYRPAIEGGRPQYGMELVDWLGEEYRKDPQFFYKAHMTIRALSRTN